MNDSNIKLSTGQALNRKKGFCRNTTGETQINPTARRGGCRRSDFSLYPGADLPPAEPVVGANTPIFTSNLKMLKEQAARLTSALKEIEAQIKAFKP